MGMSVGTGQHGAWLWTELSYVTSPALRHTVRMGINEYILESWINEYCILSLLGRLGFGFICFILNCLTSQLCSLLALFLYLNQTLSYETVQLRQNKSNTFQLNSDLYYFILMSHSFSSIYPLGFRCKLISSTKLFSLTLIFQGLRRKSTSLPEEWNLGSMENTLLHKRKDSFSLNLLSIYLVLYHYVYTKECPKLKNKAKRRCHVLS